MEQVDSDRKIAEAQSRNTLSVQVQARLERCEASLLSLLMEVKSWVQEPDPVSEAKIRDSYRRVDVAVVTNMLRMYVRQLLVSNASASAVQVQAVAAAQHDAAAAKEQLTAFKAEAARDAVMAAEKYEALKIKFNLADAKVDTGVSEATVKDLRRQVADFKSDIVKLQDQLKHREAEASEAQRKVMELTSLTNMQEKRLERLSDLEVKLQTIQMQGKSELSKKDAAFKRETDALRLQLVRFNQLEKEVGVLTEALKRSTEREKSFRKDFTKQELDDRGKLIDRLNMNISSKEADIAQLRQQLAASRKELTETCDRNAELKQEYDKLFEIFKTSQGGGSAAAASGKRPKSAGGSSGEIKISAEQAKILVDTNEHYVGFYRSRLQERDRDMKKMVGRLHKLQSEQQRSFMNEQRHLDERQQLQHELASLKMQTSASTRPQSASAFGRRISTAQAAATALPATMTFGIEEENIHLQQQVQELQNMRELSETMRKAYEQLNKDLNRQ